MRLRAKFIPNAAAVLAEGESTFHYRWHVETAIHKGNSVTEVCVRSGGVALDVASRR
jgi:hypothetical protein